MEFKLTVQDFLVIAEIISSAFTLYIAFVVFKVKQAGYNQNNDARIKLIESDVHSMKANVHAIKEVQQKITNDMQLNNLNTFNAIKKTYTALMILGDKLQIDLSKFDLTPEDKLNGHS